MHVRNPFRETYRLAAELKSADFQRASRKGAKERRGLISIGVIDDSPFEPQRNLENVGYRVAFIGDATSVDVAAPHQIVLCDLQGVGQALDPRKQGAFLIREIKRNYPEKYVVAYTGGAASQTISREAFQVSDAWLKKDAEIEIWVDKLDGFIAKLLDPYTVWQRQRLALISREVDTLTILKLEDAYVRSVIQGGAAEQSALAKTLESAKLSGDVRAVIQSLIASGLFKLLLG
jgi:hypothetical protein